MKKQWHARVRACGVGNSEDHVFHTEPSRIIIVNALIVTARA